MPHARRHNHQHPGVLDQAGRQVQGARLSSDKNLRTQRRPMSSDSHPGEAEQTSLAQDCNIMQYNEGAAMNALTVCQTLQRTKFTPLLRLRGFKLAYNFNKRQVEKGTYRVHPLPGLQA